MKGVLYFLEHSIIVLSILPSKQAENIWEIAGLKLQKGRLPKYYLFSTGDEFPEQNLYALRTYFQDSLVFIFEISPRVHFVAKQLGLDFKGSLLDVRELMFMFYPSNVQYEIEELCVQLNIIIRKKFITDAQQEARLSFELLKRCWTKGLSLELGFITKLLHYTKGLASEIFVQSLKKEITRQFPDRPIRTRDYFNSRHEFDEKLLQQERKGEIPAEASWVVKCFQPGGLLSKSFPAFENRSIQATMAQEIIKGLDGARDVLIEAGTGTGKSMAYLIPALWWVKKNAKRIVIATHTITLQEQLFRRDLPFLQKILPFHFKTALLKGKANYLCLKSFPKASLDDLGSVHERAAQAILLSWMRETLTGDLAELPHCSGLSEIWRKYAADNPLCNPNECSFTSKCYLLKARKKAEEADLLVINHSLLIADIKTNHKILPEYENLIIDEAHNIHQTALKQLGFEIYLEQMTRLIEFIAGGKTSLASFLMKNLTIWSHLYPQINWQEVERIGKEIPVLCQSVLEQTKELFSLCSSLIKDKINLRIDEHKIGSEVYQVFLLAAENVMMRMTDLFNSLERLNIILSLGSEQFESIRYEIIKNKNELNTILDGLKGVIHNEDRQRVIYLEKSGSLFLKNTLIDIASVLNKKIFSKNNCTILTSATLSIANNFSYFARDLGIEDYSSLILDSPFDYHRQMQLWIVNDMNVNKWKEEELAAKTSLFIKDVSLIMKGRTLVLFTSHRYLRLVNEYLTEELLETGLKVLAQGIDGSRDSILHQFITDHSSVLLGTNSFWEGIDIPGDRLKCVIMVRLPFWPPDSPTLEAKANLLESQGLDPFHELYLPEAIIRFKQGFGRLIRTKEDRGVVIILDDRIINKRYGRYFLKSLPIARYFQGNSEGVIQKMHEWA